MNLQQTLWGLLLIGFLVTGIYSFADGVARDYDVTIDNRTGSITNSTKEIQEDLDASYGNLSSADLSKTTQFFIGSNVAWNALKIAISAPITLVATIVDVATVGELGIEGWITGMFLVFVTLTVAFGMIAFLRGWNP